MDSSSTEVDNASADIDATILSKLKDLGATHQIERVESEQDGASSPFVVARVLRRRQVSVAGGSADARGEIEATMKRIFVHPDGDDAQEEQLKTVRIFFSFT